MRKEQFDITGMTCSACSSRVEGCVVHVKKALAAVPGVDEVAVSLEDKSAHVKLHQNVSDDAFKTVVQDLGYELTGIE